MLLFVKKNKSLFIVCCILSIALAGSVIAIFSMNGSMSSHKYAAIYQDDRLLKRIDLDSVDKTYTLRIDGENGAYNIIEVRRGSIGMTEASCPDGLCVDMGFISDSPIPVVCLPNHVVIRITGGSFDADVISAAFLWHSDI